MNTPEKKKMQSVISIIILSIGLVLMAGKIYFDSEPGAISLAMVLFGSGWYFILRYPFRKNSNS